MQGWVVMYAISQFVFVSLLICLKLPASVPCQPLSALDDTVADPARGIVLSAGLWDRWGVPRHLHTSS